MGYIETANDACDSCECPGLITIWDILKQIIVSSFFSVSRRLITIWDILKRRKAVIEVVHRHSLITIWDILKQDKGPRTLEESIV